MHEESNNIARNEVPVDRFGKNMILGRFFRAAELRNILPPALLASRRAGRMRVTAVIALSFLLDIALANAMDGFPAVSSPLPPWFESRIFSILSDGLMSGYFSENSTAKSYLDSLVEHLKKQEEHMAALNRDARYGRGNEFELCNRVQAQAFDSVLDCVSAKSQMLGFGIFKSKCITELPVALPVERNYLHHWISVPFCRHRCCDYRRCA